MATKTQIGAQIGIDGAKEYQRQLQLLVQYTKEWKSETDKLTSSFDKNAKSMENVAKERQAIEKEIGSLNEVLKLQQRRWEDLATTMNTSPTDKQQLEFSKLRTSINETSTKINTLKARLNELPTNSFFSRKDYVENAEKLAHSTDTLAAKTRSLESAMSLNGATMSGVQSKKALLNAQVQVLTTQLEVQKKRYEELRIEMLNNPSDQTKKDFNELGAEIYDTTTEINRLKQAVKDLDKENSFTVFMDNFKSGASKTGEYLKEIGSNMTRYFTVPTAIGMGASVKAAVDWESAVNGVVKTTGLAGDELEKFKDDMQDMALTTTYSAEELMGMAQIAGQLGVHGSEDLEHFVQVVSDLGIATDLTGEDAATALARIFNITENGKFDNLEAIGSVIVHLGNNMATTEPEIVAMANRMASAGKSAGLATTDIFALSAALTSVGITAEAGGSTVGQVLKTIQKDVAEFSQTGEGDLLRLAEISGMSADQFVETWKNEPIKAFEAFVTGLGNLKGEEEDIVLILDELDMAGIRQSNMLQALALAQEEGEDTTKLFTNALELTKEAFDGVNEGTENFLQLEADVRKGESATSFQNLKDAISQLAVAFGEELVPILIPFIQNLTEMIKGFSDMDDGAKKIILAIAGILAVLGPALTIVGTIMGLMSSAAVVAGALGISISALVAPIAAAVVGIGAFIAALIAVMNNWDYISEELKAGFEIFVMIVKEIGNRILEFAVNLASDIWNKFTAFINDVLTWVSTMFERLVSNVILGGVNLINRIKNIGSSIRSFFSGLASEAWNWGQDLIANMINGLSSKISSLVNSVKNVANTIWSYLHFSEPEKGALADFHTWMPDMMKGLAEGIEDNMYLVDHAINDVASTLSGGTNVNYGGVVINLNVPQGANGQQILNEIETELANRTIRRRAVFG